MFPNINVEQCSWTSCAILVLTDKLQAHHEGEISLDANTSGVICIWAHPSVWFIIIKRKSCNLKQRPYWLLREAICLPKLTFFLIGVYVFRYFCQLISAVSSLLWRGVTRCHWRVYARFIGATQGALKESWFSGLGGWGWGGFSNQLLLRCMIAQMEALNMQNKDL